MLHLAKHPCCCALLILTGVCLLAQPSHSLGFDPEPDQQSRQKCIAQIPLEKLSEPVRNKINFVLKHAQLFHRSKTEAFPCNPDVYRWLLESPDASLFAWKKLGATKANITRQDNGAFLGTDGAGGELRWHLVATGPLTRIWYAEGSGRIGPLLPTMTIRAIVVLNFQDVKGIDGRNGIKHHIELFANYDSIAIVNKLTSMSADATGKKAVQQLEVFFSGMAWYVSQHSNWSRQTFTQWAGNKEAKARVQTLLEKLEPSPITPTSAENK